MNVRVSDSRHGVILVSQACSTTGCLAMRRLASPGLSPNVKKLDMLESTNPLWRQRSANTPKVQHVWKLPRAAQARLLLKTSQWFGGAASNERELLQLRKQNTTGSVEQVGQQHSAEQS